MNPIQQSATGLVHDVLCPRRRPLDAIFAPKTVAVIGATEKPGSVGRTILANLKSAFTGTVFPVNPNRSTVLGIKAYPDVGSIPAPIDLAVIVTPAATVPAVVKECVAANVGGAIVISAGFKECGSTGAKLERDVLESARSGGMRIIGPNCLGVMCPAIGLNATFAASMAKPGNIGFLSQSGALCTAILDWSFHENVGFSAFVSVGSMLDVGWGDLIYYLGDDPRTHSIIMYMESIGDARSFLSAAREVALTKPIIVIKAGRTSAAAKAAASHTGSLTGSDEVLDAAFQRCGVLRLNRIEELFCMSEVLAKQPRPKGPRLTIITNAGGPGVLAADALIESKGELSPLAPETIKALDEFLPPHWSRNNPIDILGDADPARYAKALEVVTKDPNSDGLLVILTAQAMSDPTQTAQELAPHASIRGKPILASWMGGDGVAAGETVLNRAGIPTFRYPDTAAEIFSHMWRYNYHLQSLYEVPVTVADCKDSSESRAKAMKLIDKVRESGRTLMSEVESKQLLEQYGIPTVPTRVATSASDAVTAANEIGFPVVLKLHSETITHKTDVGGVQLNLWDADAVRRAFALIESNVQAKASRTDFLGVTVQPMIKSDGYEIILGSSIDPQFGPVLLFGLGGRLVEVLKDRALGLPPLNTTLARRMMEQTRIYKAFQGVRGQKAVDMPALEQLVVRFSELVVEQPWIKEIDINPLLVSPERMLALDARVVLHGNDVQEEHLPRLAIRPYPTRYVKPWHNDGLQATFRPIRPEDEPLMINFHKTLSAHSVYMRYFNMLQLSQRIAHERLSRLCFIDYDCEMALVADHRNPATGINEILAVGRLSKIHGTNEASFAILVSDAYQRRGLGSELLRQVIQIGRDEKMSRISGDILSENMGMQRTCKKVGFQLTELKDSGLVKAEFKL